MRRCIRIARAAADPGRHEPAPASGSGGPPGPRGPGPRGQPGRPARQGEAQTTAGAEAGDQARIVGRAHTAHDAGDAGRTGADMRSAAGDAGPASDGRGPGHVTAATRPPCGLGGRRSALSTTPLGRQQRSTHPLPIADKTTRSLQLQLAVVVATPTDGRTPSPAGALDRDRGWSAPPVGWRQFTGHGAPVVRTWGGPGARDIDRA